MDGNLFANLRPTTLAMMLAELEDAEFLDFAALRFLGKVERAMESLVGAAEALRLVARAREEL